MFTPNAIDALQSSLIPDLMAFIPELLICLGIVVMLLLRLLPGKRTHMSGVALLFSGLALVLTVFHFWKVGIPLDFLGLIDAKHQEFSGLLVVDHFTAFLRILLLGFAVLMIWLSSVTGIPDAEDSADFYTLLLGGTLGMMLMASANHLLMVFIAVEMASLPSYALAGFLKGRRQSSEASLKYVVYGGGASGVMLYGISLIAGRFGTGYLPDVAVAIQNQFLRAGHDAIGISGVDTVVLLGMVFILVGLAFKLSVVPFHFWCPDVFEGAAAEIGAFLSVASKAAAMALTARLLLMLVGTSDSMDAVALSAANTKPAELTLAIQKAIGPAIAFFAALTATFGNLAAYPQTNLKRLLAYSTIAHAGYMLMGLSVLNADGAKSVLFYLAAYVVMNLGAFAVVAILRNRTGSEDLRDFRGLVYRSPLLVVLLGLFVLSLLGLPPLIGFAAKFQVFSVLFDAGKQHSATGNPTLGRMYYALLIIGGINTVISTVYYLKILKVMVLERSLEEVEARPTEPLRISGLSMAIGASIAILAIGGCILMGLTILSSGADAQFFFSVGFGLLNLAVLAVVFSLHFMTSGDRRARFATLVEGSPSVIPLLGLLLLGLIVIPPAVGFGSGVQAFPGRFHIVWIGNAIIAVVWYVRLLVIAGPQRFSVGGAVFGSFLGFLILAGGVAWNPLSIASERGVQDFQAIYKSRQVPGTPVIGAPMGGGGPRPGGGGPRGGGGGPPGGGGGARPGGGGPRGGGAGGGRPQGGAPRQQARQAALEARS